MITALRVLCAVLALTLPVAAQTPRPAPKPAEPAPKITVAVVGDSLAGDYCRGLQRALGRSGPFALVCWAHPSSGLTRIDFFDWEAKLDEYLAEADVDIALVSMGANDAQRIVLADRVLDFETEAWAEVYGARVDATIAKLTAAGARVVWVGLPTASSARYARRLEWLNGIYEEHAKGAGVAFVPLWEMTSDDKGAYVSTLPDASGRARPARKSDGFHFSKDGETLIACALLPYLVPGPAPEGEAPAPAC